METGVVIWIYRWLWRQRMIYMAEEVQENFHNRQWRGTDEKCGISTAAMMDMASEEVTVTDKEIKSGTYGP